MLRSLLLAMLTEVRFFEGGTEVVATPTKCELFYAAPLGAPSRGAVLPGR